MTKETEVAVAPAPVMRASDREEGAEPVEIVEDVEIIASETDDNPDAVDDVRADIYKRHGEKREEEIAEQRDGAEPENPDPKQNALENDEAGVILDPGDDQSSTPTDEEPMVEVVIFEQVRMVSAAKVEKAGGVQMYQMREAAYEQMRRNNSRATELDTRETALDDRDRQTLQPPAVPATDQRNRQTPTDLPSDDQTLETMARQYQEAVYDGQDNAPSILTQMVKTAANTGEAFDKDGFRKQVTEDVLSSQRKVKVVSARSALIDANPALDKNRPDKFDHRLFQAVDDETDVVERRHPEWEPAQVIAEAWKKVSKWKGGHNTDSMADKNRDKQDLNRPRSGTKRFTPPPPAPRQTNSDYVANQRKARGLDT
jgi:hypothetical protein